MFQELAHEYSTLARGYIGMSTGSLQHIEDLKLQCLVIGLLTKALLTERDLSYLKALILHYRNPQTIIRQIYSPSILPKGDVIHQSNWDYKDSTSYEYSCDLFTALLKRFEGSDQVDRRVVSSLLLAHMTDLASAVPFIVPDYFFKQSKPLLDATQMS